MNELYIGDLMKSLENMAKNFEGKPTEFVVICSARRIIDYLSKENERLYKTCTELANTIENIEDQCKAFMEDYFKSKYGEMEGRKTYDRR